MTAELSSEQHIRQLNRDIEALEAESLRLETERDTVAKEVGRASRRHSYLRLVRWLRSPTTSFDLWPMTIMALGPLTCGAIALILVDTLAGSYPFGFFAFLIGIIAGVGLFASLIYHPADTLLPAAIAEAEAQSRLANARLTEKLGRATEIGRQLQPLLEERRQLIVSGKLQRAILLERNWKAMRGNEWEDYLVEVCRTLGAKVERTGKSGDQGVDLIVEFGPKRIAVQAKGFDELYAVNHKAVQEAYAGMAYRGCNSCAVITNSRFRRSALQLSDSTGCTLIGRDEFPDFVLGKIEL